MAGQKLRKEKSNIPNNRHNSDYDSGSSKSKATKENDSTYYFYPDNDAMRRKDNEIHFLRLFSLAAILALLILFAFHRHKTSRLEALLKAKDQQYIGMLAVGVVSEGENASVYVMMMDQFVSLIYIIAIVVGVITWCLKISEY